LYESLSLKYPSCTHAYTKKFTHILKYRCIILSLLFPLLLSLILCHFNPKRVMTIAQFRNIIPLVLILINTASGYCYKPTKISKMSQEQRTHLDGVPRHIVLNSILEDQLSGAFSKQMWEAPISFVTVCPHERIQLQLYGFS